MPTYQYACTECDHAFEQVQSFSDDSLTECPQCAGRLRKIFNAVGVVFKGSGFYRNDSRTTDAKGSDAKGPDAKGSDAKGSDAKSEGSTSPGSTNGTSGSEGSSNKSGSSSSGSSAKTTAGAA